MSAPARQARTTRRTLVLAVCTATADLSCNTHGLLFAVVQTIKQGGDSGRFRSLYATNGPQRETAVCVCAGF